MFLRLLTVLFFFVALPTYAQQNKKNYALLWEITGKNLQKPSYLFGSMHSTDKRVFEFPDSLMWKFQACEAVAVEADLDSMMQTVMNLLGDEFKKGFENNPTQRAINAYEAEENQDEYDEKDEMPPPLFSPPEAESSKSKKDWGIALNIKTDTKEVFLDAYLAKHAKLQRKKLLALEKYTSEQIKEHILGGREDKTSGILLNTLTEIYQSGDLNVLEETWNSFNRSDAENTEFIHRNYVMLESMERIMPEQSLFSVVGAAHLIGKDGLLKLLEQKGYKVRKVTATFTGKLPQPTFEPSTVAWHTITDDKAGYTFNMPFEPTHLSFEENNMKVWICPDMLDSGLFYFFIGFSLPINGQVKESELQDQIQQRLIDEMQKAMGGKVEAQKSIEMAGKTVQVYTLVNENNEKEAIQMAFMLQKNTLCMFWVGGERKNLETTPFTERFLNSFKSIPIVPKKAITFKDQQGAFSVWLPDSPAQRRNITPDPNTPKSKYDIRLFIALGEKETDLFMVRYNDFPTGYTLTNDSLYFAESVKQFEQRLDCKLNAKVIEKDGYEGREIFIEKDGAKNKVRMYMRGNRFYLLMSQTAVDADIDGFFDSFTFLPCQTPELSRQYPKDSLYSMLIPHKLKKRTIDGNKMQTVTDRNSGTLYTITDVLYDEYDFVAHIDSLWKYNNQILIDKNDTLLSIQKGTWKNAFYEDVLVYNKSAKNYNKVRKILKGNKLHWIVICGSKESVMHKSIDLMLNSIEFTPSKDTVAFSLFASKAQKLLTDIYSENEETAEKAYSRLYKYDFQTQDIPILVNFLHKEATHKIDKILPQRLISALAGIASDTIPKILKGLYESKRFGDFESHILDELWQINSPASRELAYQLAYQRPPQETENYRNIGYRWSGLKIDSIAPYYKKISENTENKYFRHLFVSFSAMALRKSKVEELQALVQPEMVKLAKLADKYYASPEDRSQLLNYGEIYEMAKSKQEYHAFAKRVLVLDSLTSWQKFHFVKNLVIDKIPVEPAWIEPILKDTTMVNDACLFLLQHNQLKPFEKYYNPVNIGKDVLNESHDYEYSFNFLGKEQVNYKGKKGWVYAYEYETKLSEEDSTETIKRIAIAGLFLIGKKKAGEPGLTYDFANTIDDDVVGKTWREKVKTYIKTKEQ